METWAIIFNPTAGTFRPHKLERVQRALHGHGVRAHLLATERAGHATELAREVGGVARVAAFGGDGTLNEVANGLLGRPLPLVFLPAGTANVMAWELGIPLDPARAAVAGLRSRPHPVRPGIVNGRAFLLMAGFGFDGDTVHGVSARLKDWIGKGAYVWSGLQAALRTPAVMTVHAQGERGTEALEGCWLVVARARHYGGPYTVHPDADLLDPALRMTLVRRGWLLPFVVAHLGLNLHRERRGVALRTVHGLELACDRAVHVQIDGDYLGQGDRFRVGMAPETVQLCFPWR